MPTDGHSAAGGGKGGNVKSTPMRKGDGPSANRMDGGRSGATGAMAHGMGKGNARDMSNGSPMKGPSMGGVLKYIKSRGSGEKTAGSEGRPSGGDEYESPYPTGGAPTKEFNEGNDVPGESREERDMGADACPHCAGSGKKKKGGVSYSQSNHEMSEPARGNR